MDLRCALSLLFISTMRPPRQVGQNTGLRVCHVAPNSLRHDLQVIAPVWSTILRPGLAPLLRVRARDLAAHALLVLMARQARHHTRPMWVPSRLAWQPLQTLAWRAAGLLATRGAPRRPVFTHWHAGRGGWACGSRRARQGLLGRRRGGWRARYAAAGPGAGEAAAQAHHAHGVAGPGRRCALAPIGPCGGLAPRPCATAAA